MTLNLGTARGAIISAALFGRFFDANRVLKLNIINKVQNQM